MGYPQEIQAFAIVPQSNAFLTAHTFSTTPAAVYATWVAHMPCLVQKLLCQVSTAVNDLTATVVGFERVTVGNVTTSLGTITIPNGTAARKVLYKDVTPLKIDVGDKLQVIIKTCGVQGGTAAGAGFYGWYGSIQPEAMTNATNAIVSA